MYPYTFGFDLTSDGTGSISSTSNNAWTTAFMHGDYDMGAATSVWASGVTQTLPASFFLSGKPSWWGSLPWPAIGPDVAAGPGPGGHAYGNPAEICYNSTSRDASGILQFNPATCYSHTVAGGPLPPTGLTAIVN